ncbi:MAG: peptide ABC transporter substrate-binding protein, partial [Armatimonadetes bacterium]|nr:peptide ABC transporter substrate-binding protein [Armatimonadota bacterium]
AGELAERWEISEDSLTWTFHLRRNVKWHDGRPFTADDVVFTAQAALDDRNKSRMRPYYRIGGRPVRVEKADASTVRFVLPEPTADFLYNMSQWNLMLPRHLLEGKDLATVEFNVKPVGTGPFRFVELQDQQFIRMAANPDYHLGRPKLDVWIERAFEDEDAALAAFAKGDVDLVAVDTSGGLQKARRFSNARIYAYTAAWIFSFNMNLKAGFFGDIRVRQALAHAFDHEQLVKSVAGDAPVAWSLIGPPSSWAYDPNVPKYRKDTARARALLSAAGFKPGPDGILRKDGKPFRFTVLIQSDATDSNPDAVAAALRQAFRDLGVAMEVERLEKRELGRRLFREPEYEAYLWWNGYPFDPDPRFYWHSASAINNYAHPALDKLIEQAASASRPEVRKRLLDTIAEKIAKDAAFIPLYYLNRYVVTRSALKFPQPSAADFSNSGVLYDVHTIQKTR